MPVDFCYDDDGMMISCSNIEIGQQYYDAMAQWQETGDAGQVSNFFDVHLQQFLNPADGEYIASTNQFLDAYGQYITNIVPDWGSFDRFERITDIQNRQFLGDYQDQVSALYNQQGKQGLYASGKSLLEQEDFWRQYEDRARRGKIEQLQGEEGIYGAWGEDFYNALESIAEEAFVEGSGYDDSPGDFDQCLASCDDYDTVCLENCLGYES